MLLPLLQQGETRETGAIDGESPRAPPRSRFLPPQLFKTREFLSKHLEKKHGTFKEHDLASEKDEYLKVMYEKGLPRRLPKVCVKVPGGEVEVKVKGTFEEPEVKDVWEEIRREREVRERQEAERYQQQYAPGGGGPLNRLDGSREVTTFIDVDDMKDESKEVVVDEEKLKRALEGDGGSGKKKKKRRRMVD